MSLRLPEVFGLTIAEDMLRGLPVPTTDRPDNVEFLTLDTKVAELGARSCGAVSSSSAIRQHLGQ